MLTALATRLQAKELTKQALKDAHLVHSPRREGSFKEDSHNEGRESQIRAVLRKHTLGDRPPSAINTEERDSKGSKIEHYGAFKDNVKLRLDCDLKVFPHSEIRLRTSGSSLHQSTPRPKVSYLGGRILNFKGLETKGIDSPSPQRIRIFFFVSRYIHP